MQRKKTGKAQVYVKILKKEYNRLKRIEILAKKYWDRGDSYFYTTEKELLKLLDIALQ